jgi:microcystin-dependent protein
MGTPFLGEVKIISWNFAPQGWAFCNGQFLPINQNQALFSILGTTYGGNGQTTFALPDLRGRTPIYTGQGFALGEKAGENAHTLTQSEMAAHTHFPQGNGNASSGTLGTPLNNFWADGGKSLYSTGGPNTAMLPTAVSNVGGSQPHENTSPYLVLNFIIALVGVFPSRN